MNDDALRIALLELEEDIRDLAAALETAIASMLIGARDPTRATELLLAAQVMAAEIHGELDDAHGEGPQA
jgi:adenine-specific DNA glycosylase